MKPIFHHTAVNGPFGDPAVFVRILREKKAILFDAGDISALSARDLMKITDVFVTHMHIDHFIGFDTLLRVLLKREQPVTFYGPSGIIDCVQGKLRGYTWNLISEYPLIIRVVEVQNAQIHAVTFRACDRFSPAEEKGYRTDGNLIDNPLFAVTAVGLEHDVPCLGFSIKEKIHINIDKAKLADRGFEVGPWLNVLKNAVRRNRPDEAIDTGKGIYPASDLEDVYLLTEGQKVSYVMDASPTDSNIERITRFVADADSLYIEGYFMHEDIALARRKNHLTARISGRIAKKAHVKHLHLLHFSPRYSGNAEIIYKEAHGVFADSTDPQ